MHCVTSPLCSTEFSFTSMKSAAGSFIFFSYLIFLLKFPPAHLRKPLLFGDSPRDFLQFPLSGSAAPRAGSWADSFQSGFGCELVSCYSSFCSLCRHHRYREIFLWVLLYIFPCLGSPRCCIAPALSLPGDLSMLLYSDSIARRGAETTVSLISIRFNVLKV